MTRASRIAPEFRHKEPKSALHWMMPTQAWGWMQQLLPLEKQMAMGLLPLQVPQTVSLPTSRKLLEDLTAYRMMPTRMGWNDTTLGRSSLQITGSPRPFSPPMQMPVKAMLKSSTAESSTQRRDDPRCLKTPHFM